MTTSLRMVVVGADAAGMSAAHQALRGAARRGRRIEVVVLERSQHTSYSACGLPYWVAGDVDGPARLLARSAAQHREMGVDLRMGATATGLDLDAGFVEYVDDAGGHRVDFDEVVLATGAAPIVPRWARDDRGALRPGVRPLKNLDDGAYWIDRFGGGRPGRAVVVGGGYVGLEMAEALLRRGWSTTLITRSRVMNTLDEDMSTRIEPALAEAGVEVVSETTAVALECRGAAGATAVATADGRTYAADAVVLATGVEPVSELGAAAGLPLGKSGGYLPDPAGRLAAGVWAAGDCCESLHRVTGEYVFFPLGTHANKQGRVVGENISGGSATFGGVLGTAVTRFAAGGAHVEVAHTGLTSAEAETAGLRTAGLVTEGRTASGYMPQARPIATKVLAERGTRRLLGMQIVGGQGAGKRIDTAAAALWGRLTVDDLAQMDLAYAPPFATVWEAVQLAARRLADRL